MTPTKECGVWAWLRKTPLERTMIQLTAEYRRLGELHKNTDMVDSVPEKFLDLAREHDHHEDSDWEV